MISEIGSSEPHVTQRSRILPRSPVELEQSTPLSLLDATTANFGLTSAIWLLERPTIATPSGGLAAQIHTALSITLDAYPQWCGHLKAILSIDQADLPPETATFPTHAKRYGRVYVHYGTSTDPGVEFVEATSAATVDSLYRAGSARRRPIWDRLEDKQTLVQFVPSTKLVSALEPNGKDENGLQKPNMAVQYTELACGGIVLAAKIAHPLADISALTRFVRDWASVSRAMLANERLPMLNPVFGPSRLDDCAAGDIDAAEADPTAIKDAMKLPLHRYDWWAPPAQPPPAFPADLALAGEPMPWAEWDTMAPVEQYTIHLSRKQIDHLWQSAMKDSPDSSLKVSKHDALLAHIWSCVVRARGLQEDSNPVHCDLVLGVRPAFQLDDSFVGSPTMMLNIEMTAKDVASGHSLGSTAQRVRETISTVNNPDRLAAHLHSIAYEKSPQRIWQAFLGQRHILVTSWARAGIYDIVFGFGSRIRYADGVVPCLDGCVLIVDGPPSADQKPGDEGSGVRRGWADNGVDVTLPLRYEDMKRLLSDPALLPKV